MTKERRMRRFRILSEGLAHNTRVLDADGKDVTLDLGVTGIEWRVSSEGFTRAAMQIEGIRIDAQGELLPSRKQRALDLPLLKGSTWGLRVAWSSPRRYVLRYWLFSAGHYARLTTFVRICGVLVQWYRGVAPETKDGES
jgi:hypothetical protein